MHLHWIVKSCAHFGGDLHASGCKFFTVLPPNPSQHKLSDVHLLL